MSLGNVRVYFRNAFNSAGFKEWRDGFNRDDIPSTILNKSYHILTPSISLVAHNQILLELNENVNVAFYLKGYRDPSTAIDEAHTLISDLLKIILDHKNRTQSGVKNVRLNSVSIEPLAIENDNVISVTILFEVYVIMDVNK